VQASCPQCAQRIAIDDAKVPDRPFKVKCPKCGNSVTLPGKGAAAPAAVPDTVAPGAPAEAPPAPASDELRTQLMADLRREMGMAAPAGAGRALVSLADRAVAGAVTGTLSRLGYQVDNIDDPEEGARLLEQGLYNLVATSRAGAVGARGENLYQRINRLSPENRRRIFMVLVNDQYQSGDSLQAWTAVADLVLNGRDAATAEATVRNTLSERQRLYQVFLDARRRFEESAG
jgi:predicted Zn finger-like uncharacterized protein